MSNLLTIDGSYGEGGGQILRTALSLSCLLRQPIIIENIRAGRKNPGLQPQHLTSLKAAEKISRAKVKGDSLGSESITFEPESLQGGLYHFDVAEKKGSAGSVGLVLQTFLPVLAFAKEKSFITVKGGTHTSWSPPFHYIEQVFLPNLSKMGVHVHATLERWGFYPLGGGEVTFEITPLQKLSGREWKREHQEMKKVSGVSAVANLPLSIAERQRDRALERLNNTGFEGDIEIVEAVAIGKGSFLFLRSEYETLRCGFSSLGERGKLAEKVADGACQDLLHHHHSDTALDPNMADQILIYASLAEGETHFTTAQITNHFMTNLWVLKRFLPLKMELKGRIGEKGKISLEGVGYGGGSDMRY